MSNKKHNPQGFDIPADFFVIISLFTFFTYKIIGQLVGFECCLILFKT